MEWVLARSRFRAPFPAQRRTSRGIAFALANLRAVLDRLVSPQREVPPEFFRYPLP